MEKDRMTKKRFTFEILAIATKIIRSVLFNILMFGIGFVVGVGVYHLKEHQSHSSYDYQIQVHQVSN